MGSEEEHGRDELPGDAGSPGTALLAHRAALYVSLPAATVMLFAWIVLGTTADLTFRHPTRVPPSVGLALALGGSAAVLFGLALARGLAAGAARWVTCVAGAAAAGLVAASPALGRVWGPRPAVLVEALVALAVLGLIAQGAEEGEPPPAPAPHELVRRLLLGALLAGAPAGLVVYAAGALTSSLSEREVVSAAVFLTVGGAVWAAVFTLAEGVAARARRPRTRLGLLAAVGLGGPLAIAVTVLWTIELVWGSGGTAGWAHAWGELLELLEDAWEDYDRTIGLTCAFLAPFLLLGAARGRVLAVPASLPARAAVTTLGLLVTASVVEQRGTLSPRVRLWFSQSALLAPWALLLGLEAARRLDGWLVARWERRWAD